MILTGQFCLPPRLRPKEKGIGGISGGMTAGGRPLRPCRQRKADEGRFCRSFFLMEISIKWVAKQDGGETG